MFTHLNRYNSIKLEQINPVNAKRYYLKDNIKYHSITSVLDFKEKPELIAWKKRMGAQADIISEKARTRGTKLHNVLESHLMGLSTTELLDDQDVKLFFNQFKTIEKNINNIDGLELMMCSDSLGLAGTTDLVAEYNKVPSIIDYKTSKRVKTKSMITDYFLQSTAYALMFNESFNETVEQIVILMFVEDSLKPLVFIDSIDKYVKPLLERLHDYNARNK